MKRPPRRTVKPSLVIDDTRHEVYVDGKRVQLPRTLYLILRELKNETRTLSRKELLHRVWGEEYANLDTRTVDQQISRLRRKIGAHYVETDFTWGYRFTKA